jgi:hypothetical protein
MIAFDEATAWTDQWAGFDIFSIEFAILFIHTP